MANKLVQTCDQCSTDIEEYQVSKSIAFNNGARLSFHTWSDSLAAEKTAIHFHSDLCARNYLEDWLRKQRQGEKEVDPVRAFQQSKPKPAAPAKPPDGLSVLLSREEDHRAAAPAAAEVVGKTCPVCGGINGAHADTCSPSVSEAGTKALEKALEQFTAAAPVQELDSAATTKRLSPGDVVRLLSGGYKMTVERISDYGLKADVVWFDDNHAPHRGAFPVAQLAIALTSDEEAVAQQAADEGTGV